VFLDLEVKLHLRNAISKLQSLAHNFLSPRFTDLFNYRKWYKMYMDSIKVVI